MKDHESSPSRLSLVLFKY